MKHKRKMPLPVIATLGISSGTMTHVDEERSRWKLSGGLDFGMLPSGYRVNLGVKNNSSLIYASVGCDEYASLHNCDFRFSLGYFRSGSRSRFVSAGAL